MLNNTKKQLDEQMHKVNNDKNIPEHVRIQLNNFAGFVYHTQGLLDMTMHHNQTRTLSPLAAMEPKITLDFAT